MFVLYINYWFDVAIMNRIKKASKLLMNSLLISKKSEKVMKKLIAAAKLTIRALHS